MLNALIINSSECMPSNGFDEYLKDYNETYELKGDDERDWGELVAECWAHYHIKQNKKQQFGAYTDLKEEVGEWLEDYSVEVI